MPPLLKRCLLIAVAATAVLGIERAGVLRTLDDAIAEQRMASAQRPATGGIVYLAIDKKSLDSFGVWPWPRQIHARVIDKLVALDAAEIALDIDFSAASDPQADRALARALQDAGGSVILPVFLQRTTADHRDARLSENLPLPAFRAHAWVGSVNVATDGDGMVRRFSFGQTIDGEDTPSIPSLLSGEIGVLGADFLINFSIRPQSVPTVSVSDLLADRAPGSAIRGRTVIVGAHAVELRDNYSVPVHGIQPGVMVQILAAETLVQGIALRPIDSRPLVLGLAILLCILGSRLDATRLVTKLIVFGAIVAALEAAGFMLQTRHALVLPTAAAHLMLLGLALVVAVQELDLRRWLIRLARVRADNTQAVLERIIDDSSDAVLVVAEDGRVLEISRTAARLFGPATQAGTSARLADIAPAEMARCARDSIAELRAGRWRDRGPRELAIGDGAGARVFEYTTTPSRLSLAQKRSQTADDDMFVTCITARDITEQRRHEARLDYLSRFDEMTGAMRRSEFLARLERRLAQDPQGCAVLALGLHRFKTVNATLGRAVGDLILASVARRLESCDPRLSGVARLGGDSFALYTATAVDRREAEAIGRMLTGILNQAFEVDGTTARVGVHIGFTIVDAATTRLPNALLGDAELALDEAKKVGGNALKAFEPASSARQERARRIERELWTALDNDEIHIAYQPQVRLSDLRLVGAEALIRWRHPTLGVVSPADFIEIAEANGFVEELGRWVLGRACRDAALWPADLTVAVNVSPVQFGRSDIIRDTAEALAASGLPPTRLHLEITESLFLDQSADFLEMLRDIRMLGVSLALDDFGSGFSSLGYLAKFPLDKIKVDQMFVRRLETDTASQAILKSVKMLSDELGIKLICEGIETAEQLAYLRAIGCDEGQGYLFGKPQPMADMLRLCAGPHPDSGTG